MFFKESLSSVDKLFILVAYIVYTLELWFVLMDISSMPVLLSQFRGAFNPNLVYFGVSHLVMQAVMFLTLWCSI